MSEITYKKLLFISFKNTDVTQLDLIKKVLAISIYLLPMPQPLRHLRTLTVFSFNKNTFI